ncbi:sugar kinase [Actinomadura violacea]|uniref:Sugar kinase n=1 Tax=Actinomadura violacea TaxID=2819934 RepID=A0ABS3S8R7_9ACTN|nr:sugar kinase [Actinomadura violacea]MBO2465409.1 sugar kinase [Actinomadura violacea]
MTEVVTCGESMLLLLASPGVPLARAHTFQRSVAGAESNVAIGLARLGHSTAWLSRVGADPSGQAVLDTVRGAGVDTSLVHIDPDAPTGLLLRDSHPGRPIDVQYYRDGSAASRLEPSDVTLPPGTRLVHFTGITPMLSATARAATDRLVRLARQSGAEISFDPNVRLRLGTPSQWRGIAGPFLAEADIVITGADELDLLGVQPDRAHTVVVKHPDRSATSGRHRQECFPVPATDPVGAGDAFAAGFLSGRLRGLDTPSCLREAAAVAAFAVQTATDIDGLPTGADRDRLLNPGADVIR